MPARSATALGLLGALAALAGCAWGGEGPNAGAMGSSTSPDAAFTSPASVRCDQAEGLPQGPLRGDESQEIPYTWFRKPGVPGKPETFAQMRLIELENDGTEPLILDRVCLIAAPHRSPDVLGGQRVTKRNPWALWPHWHGSDKGVVPLRGYRLPPNKAQLPYLPVLDILIGPANHPGKFSCSENAAIRVLYHTPDGKEWQRIYVLAVEFPNHPGGTATRCDKKYNAWFTYLSTHAVPPTASP